MLNHYGIEKRKCWCKYGQSFHLIEKHAIDTKKHYYEVEPLGVRSIFWKKQVMVVCMQYAKGILQVFWSINTVYSGYTHVIWDGILKVY